MACSLMPTGKAHSHIGCFLKWFSKFAAVSEVGLLINAFSNLSMILPLVYLVAPFRGFDWFMLLYVLLVRRPVIL